MKSSRRLKRMARRSRKVQGMNLTSLMDVFTILVFFLLTNSSSEQAIDPPKEITLPDSVVETKPKQNVVIMVSETDILVQGKIVADTRDLLQSKEQIIVPVANRLIELRNSVIGISTKTVAESKEVTILAHKSIPFKVLKKIMGTCSGAGYSKISLAVIQKASQSQ
ncbi:MAG: biopolymer transporter ExbD [Gammaproteobacteria bacterium]|nr:biopolymer transporter ExbD [Gammaproteobacteria bacterium]